MPKRMPNGEGRQPVNTRLRVDLRAALQREANTVGRTLSAEIEARLEASFREADLRAIVREEMQAALAGMERLYIKSNGQL